MLKWLKKILEKSFANNELALFLLCGAIAATVNFGSRFFLNFFLSFKLSIVMAYILGMVTAYLLNRFVVFSRNEVHTLKSLAWFTLVNLFALSQTYIITLGLHVFVFPAVGVELFSKEISHFFGVLFPVASSYIGHKYLSFRNNS